MRTFLLLLLPLMAGCKDVSPVTGYRGGWVEFICKYPKSDGTYTTVTVTKGNKKLIETTEKNEWQKEGRYSIYHDTVTKSVRVVIRQLQQQDSGTYKCEFESKSSEEEETEVKLKVGKDECQVFTQTAYRTAKTTMSCDHQGNSGGSQFFCKDNGSICSSFNMSISNVSSQHAGVFWCGQEADGGRYRAALRQIRLKVKATIRNFTKSPAVGQSLTYWCQYETQRDNKFICKGEDPSICEPLVTTEQPNAGRFSMKDDTDKRKITITVRDVTSEDTGTYWCGAQTSDQTRSNPFFHRLNMTVVRPTPPSSASPPPGTPSVSSTRSTTGAAGSAAGQTGESWVTVVIVVVVCVALLVLLLVVVLSYKRLQRSRNTRTGKLQNEDGAYAEIQERPQKPDAGAALQTIYVTADAPTVPTVPSAPQFYSTVDFHSGSGDAGGDTYSTVRDVDQCPAYSTVNHPPRIPEDPVYSMAVHPQQH